MKHLYARIDPTKNIVEFHSEDEKSKEILSNPPAPLWEVWDSLKKSGWVNCSYHECPKEDESGFLHWWYPENDKEVLELFLIQHDFKFVDHAEDSREHRYGVDSLKRVKKVMKLLDHATGVSLWNKYAPADMKME